VAAYGSENDTHGSPQPAKARNGQRVTITLYFNKHKSVDIRAGVCPRSDCLDHERRR
jgi:hypothetical protein